MSAWTLKCQWNFKKGGRMKKLILFLAITTSVFCEQIKPLKKAIDYYQVPKISFSQNATIEFIQPLGQEMYQIYDSISTKRLIGIIVYDRKNN